MTGRKHEVEPEVDSLSFIDFEGDDQGYQTAVDLGGRDLENWWVESGLAFLSSASVIPDGADENVVRDQLHEEYQCSGEELFWGWVIDQALDAGFDVYDSDTRTELFPGGTRCNEVCPADCVGEDDLHQEHISGGHGDTRRGDCPRCEEAFGASSTPIPAAKAIQPTAYAVAVYDIGRSYGGPEEGGWWYTHGELVGVRWYLDEDEANDHALALNEAYRSEDRFEPSRAAHVVAIPRQETEGFACHEDDDALSEVTRWDVPTSFPERAPHYC